MTSEKTRKIIFWTLGLFFLITNFIRTFIEPKFGESIRLYFRDFPIGVKVAIIILAVAFLVYIYPYRKRKNDSCFLENMHPSGYFFSLLYRNYTLNVNLNQMDILFKVYNK
ncbi:hypothetical protein [Bacillus toyonensis]|uniref:hypothetical protein n=1 Tax=Bacillus toyonensis TaxID=155322 RepID=UPI00115ED824|nr:hypothetical protein [Bacillus toyonensis]